MIDLSFKINLFAPIIYACPDCLVQPGHACSGVPHTEFEQPVYHRARVDLAFMRGMEAYEASKQARRLA